jgi:mono/diheme cytochrome c family protein
MSKIKKILLIILGIILITYVLIQFVPYGHDHTNPPVLAEPQWDSPRTRELFMQVCGDCHSNETVWPWYSNIAPVSWLVQHDVEEGRAYLNVSEWGSRRYEADESAGAFKSGNMPPAIYFPMHPEARLSDTDVSALITGLTATFGR